MMDLSIHPLRVLPIPTGPTIEFRALPFPLPEAHREALKGLPSGRPRKLSKNGTDGSMNWAQLMLHKGLIPTPELCEYYMGWPIGATALQPLETARFQEWLQRHGG